MSRSTVAAAEVSAADLIQPNTLLPEQFAAALRQKGFMEGEKRLLAAVLADAVDCYQKHADATERRARELFREAEVWIFDESRSELFSFNTVCEVLGLEPDYVRNGLLAWRRRHLSSSRVTRLPRPEGDAAEHATEEEESLSLEAVG